jgi:hypothetical protein
MKLDDLLSQSADVPHVPDSFVQDVHHRIQFRALQKRQRKLLRDSVLLGGTFVLFFYSLSVLLINAIAVQTFDFYRVIIDHPSLLTLSEGRSALLEAIPITSLLLVCVTAGISLKLLQVFLRDMHPFYTLIFYKHATS